MRRGQKRRGRMLRGKRQMKKMKEDGKNKARGKKDDKEE